jgi:hypothetical protein
LFRIDDRRQLLLSVIDLKTKAELLHDHLIYTLR